MLRGTRHDLSVSLVGAAAVLLAVATLAAAGPAALAARTDPARSLRAE